MPGRRFETMELPVRDAKPRVISAGEAGARGLWRGTGRRDGGAGALQGLQRVAPAGSGREATRCPRQWLSASARGSGGVPSTQGSRLVRRQLGGWWLYSVSVFQSVGGSGSGAGHCGHPACNLRASFDGGIDLPARPVAVCGLNSRQINHLQRYASETHYRGQRRACNAAGEMAGSG